MLSRRDFIGGLALGGGLAGCAPMPAMQAAAATDANGQFRFVRRGTVSFYSPPTALAWSPDLRRMAGIVNFGRAVEVVDIASGRRIFMTPRWQSLDHAGVCFSPDGREVYSLSPDLNGALAGPIIATAWEAETGKVLRYYMRPPEPEFSRTGFNDKLALSPDGKFLAIIGNSSRPQTHCFVFRTSDPILLQKILTGGEAWFRFATISVRNQMVTATRRPNEVRSWQHLELYDLESGAKIRTFEGHRNEIKDVAFSADGSLLVSGEDLRQRWHDEKTDQSILDGDDDPIRIWNVDTGAQIGGVVHESLPVSRLFWLGSSRMVLSKNAKSEEGRRGSQMCIWDPFTGSRLAMMETADRGSAAYSGVAPSPDGKLLALANTSTVEIYGIEPG